MIDTITRPTVVFKVIEPERPADWPSDEEIAAICQPKYCDMIAKAVISLMDPEDYELYSKFAEREREIEEGGAW